MRSEFLHAAAIAALASVIAIPVAQRAQAQTYQVLYDFSNGADGGLPLAGVVQDARGNLYGTAYEGGGTGCLGNRGCGVVFKVDPSGKETVLYSFQGGSDGVYPEAGLIRDADGNFYGTTYAGGTSSGAFTAGYGTIFELSKSGKETVLYRFKGGSDGAYPSAPVIRDAKGNLYGTTLSGGNPACYSGCGTVFKLSRSGKETVLYRFGANDTDGLVPAGGLIQDNAGNLYGTTQFGGTGRYECTGDYEDWGCGTVFRIDRNLKEAALYRFCPGLCSDGANPSGGVIRDADGNLYGTTTWGGAYGGGTVFMLNKEGESVLYSLGAQNGDGFLPAGGVTRDAQGNLYSMTTYGGGGPCRGPLNGCGTVFKVDSSGNETVLHAFQGQSDGYYPTGSLALGVKGTLYGTTSAFDGGKCLGDCGTVFKLTP